MRQALCWLLGTSVQKIGLLSTMEQAFLPKIPGPFSEETRSQYRQGRFLVKQCGHYVAFSPAPLHIVYVCEEVGMPQPILNSHHEGASSIAPNARNDAFCACVNPFTPLISSRS
jgi:hypothetical protein